MCLHTHSLCEGILEYLDTGASFDYPEDLNSASLADFPVYSLLC